MKIGIDVSPIIYKGSGVARYLERLVIGLSQLVTDDQLVLFGYSLRRKANLKAYCEKLGNKNITYKLFPFPQTIINFIWNNLHLFPVENLIGKIDLFHSSDWIEPPANCSKVTTIHDLSIIKFPALFPKTIIRTQMRKLTWVKKEADAIVVDSFSTKEDCLSLLSLDERKIHVVYPGIDERFTPQSKEEISRVKKKYGIDNPYILSVGKREPRKNLHKLILAFQNLNRKNLLLVMAGGVGWGKDLSIPQGVKALGYIPDEDLPALYSGATAFVYPSLYEGFGFPVLEAMACGTPVVCSDKGSLKEIGGKLAIRTDPEKIESLALAIEKSLEISNNEEKAGLVSWARRFTWGETAKKTLAVYHKFS